MHFASGLPNHRQELQAMSGTVRKRHKHIFPCFSRALEIIMNHVAYSIIIFVSSTGRRPASLCHGPLSVVRLCVRPCIKFFLNIFSETYRILMKFHRNVPGMVSSEFIERI